MMPLLGFSRNQDWVEGGVDCDAGRQGPDSRVGHSGARTVYQNCPGVSLKGCSFRVLPLSTAGGGLPGHGLPRNGQRTPGGAGGGLTTRSAP